MRGDLLQDNKGIHIKLKKDIHTFFRAEMFKAGISMQEAFNEFALQVSEGTKSGKNIVDSAAAKKIKRAIDKIPRKKEKDIGEVDIDTLYDLINAKISDIT